MKECPKCNSDKIVPNAMVLDTGQASHGFLLIAFDEDPNALIFKNRIKSGVKVSVCGECGYLEFYAESPQAIYQAYQNMLENTGGKNL